MAGTTWTTRNARGCINPSTAGSMTSRGGRTLDARQVMAGLRTKCGWTVKVELSEEARAQVERIDAWWQGGESAGQHRASSAMSWKLALLFARRYPDVGRALCTEAERPSPAPETHHYHLYVNFTPWRPRQGEVAPSTLNCLLGGYRSPGLGVGPRLGSPSRGPLGGIISYFKTGRSRSCSGTKASR